MSIFGAEVIGTALLILLGNGVVACVLLNLSKGQNSGWIVITFGWGMAVMVGAFAVGQFSGAHLNPAVTRRLRDRRRHRMERRPRVLRRRVRRRVHRRDARVARLPGPLAETEDPGLKLACFSTAPAIRNPVSNMITEIIGTFVLVFGILAFFANEATAATGLGALIVGLLVLGIGLSLGGPTGYAINPARDLGPRIMHAILPIAGKGDSDWGYAWIPVVGAAHRRRARRAARSSCSSPADPGRLDRTGRAAPPGAARHHFEERGELMAKYAAAIDQGTTSTRCMVFDHGGNVVSVAQKEHEQIYPKPGWVEHDVDGDLGAHAGGRRRGDGLGRRERGRRRRRRHHQPARDRGGLGQDDGQADPQRARLAGHAHGQARRRVLARTAARPASRRRSACRWRPTSRARRSAGCSTTSTARRRRPSRATCCSATWTPGSSGT